MIKTDWEREILFRDFSKPEPVELEDMLLLMTSVELTEYASTALNVTLNRHKVPETLVDEIMFLYGSLEPANDI